MKVYCARCCATKEFYHYKDTQWRCTYCDYEVTIYTPTHGELFMPENTSKVTVEREVIHCTYYGRPVVIRGQLTVRVEGHLTPLSDK